MSRHEAVGEAAGANPTSMALEQRDGLVDALWGSLPAHVLSFLRRRPFGLADGRHRVQGAAQSSCGSARLAQRGAVDESTVDPAKTCLASARRFGEATSASAIRSRRWPALRQKSVPQTAAMSKITFALPPPRNPASPSPTSFQLRFGAGCRGQRTFVETRRPRGSALVRGCRMRRARATSVAEAHSPPPSETTRSPPRRHGREPAGQARSPRDLGQVGSRDWKRSAPWRCAQRRSARPRRAPPPFPPDGLLDRPRDGRALQGRSSPTGVPSRLKKKKKKKKKGAKTEKKKVAAGEKKKKKKKKKRKKKISVKNRRRSTSGSVGSACVQALASP